MKRTVMSSPAKPLPKMMLGFVVRRCAAALGHEPTAEEFAAWANQQREGDRAFYLFGRAISVSEARVILGHRGRPVTARSARPHECVDTVATTASPKVTSFASAATRLRARARARSK